LPDDDAGREYLKELLLPISLGPNEACRRSGGKVGMWTPTDKMRREIELWAPWMSEDEADELLDEINRMPTWERKTKAGPLGQRLNLTYPERARLDLRTIAACDVTEAVMVQIRKQKKRQQNRLRYNKSRPEYLAGSLTQTKPWEQDGISRRTWERRRVASQRHINLTKTSLLLATKEKEGVSVSECVRVATATPAGQTWTCVSEMDWLGWTPELAAEVAKGAGAICPPEARDLPEAA
jgi:hypothetical protein